MKKAGIITIFGEYNYGNRLQNYAVQQVLRRQGLDAETIRYIGYDDYAPSINSEISKNRLKKFKEFNKYINFAKETLYKTEETPKSIKEDYDYIVLGSDQIWNYTLDKTFSDKAFGSFVPANKRFSLSASFGINHAPEKNTKFYEMYKDNLQNMKAISVRETAGKEIVNKLTGRDDAEVLIDPTMMVDISQWEKLIKKPESLKTDKFIVKSFLGDASEEILKEIDRIAKENGCEIIDILDNNNPYYDMGPAEFLYLEKNAFLVATDSFHSCVFSILFSTPFVVFERQDNKLENMHSRIETLVEKFDLGHRIFKDKITDDILSKDFARVQELLENERQKANNFLQKALA